MKTLYKLLSKEETLNIHILNQNAYIITMLTARLDYISKIFKIYFEPLVYLRPVNSVRKE